MKSLSADWTADVFSGEVTYSKDLEAELSKILCEEIDWEITHTLLASQGWLFVAVAKSIHSEKYTEIKQWTKDNCSGKVHSHNNEWLFELKQDAEWFTLRWV